MVIALVAMLILFCVIAVGGVALRIFLRNKATNEIIVAEKAYPPFSQEAMKVMFEQNESEMEAMENKSIATFDNATETLDKTINSIEFDKLIDNKVNNIIVKDCKYFSLPSKENVLLDNIFIKFSGKVDISNQKVKVPDQKIEIPKQVEVPSVAKEPPKKVDLSRKVDLDVE